VIRSHTKSVYSEPIRTLNISAVLLSALAYIDVFSPYRSCQSEDMLYSKAIFNILKRKIP
jgi:hypothetical protein